VNRLEKIISELETAQAERNRELNDPDTYSDPDGRAALLQAFQTAATELDRRTAEWAIAGEKLDEAESDLAAR